jgi:hypothetical protein
MARALNCQRRFGGFNGSTGLQPFINELPLFSKCFSLCITLHILVCIPTSFFLTPLAELHLACDSVICDAFQTQNASILTLDHHPALLLLQSPGHIFPAEPCYDSSYLHRSFLSSNHCTSTIVVT